MNTFILRWNPNISSYKMETHLDIISHAREMEFPNQFDWSVYEWQKVKDGDMVIMLQVGTDNDGIAMIGKIKGEPQADESWKNDSLTNCFLSFREQNTNSAICSAFL